MSDSKVLIITTAHDLEDGRLVRHKSALQRNKISTEIVALKFKNRMFRFLLGPWLAYLKIRRAKPHCVILPDPELQLLLPIFIRNKPSVIADVHEAYELVAEDRAWISSWFKPIVNYFVWGLSLIRNRCADAIIVADQSIDAKCGVYVSNRPNPVDFSVSQPPKVPQSLVYVGDIRESRGMEEMIKLIEITPKVCLDLIGPCSNEKNLLNMIDKRNLSDRIKWHGRLPYRQSWEIASTAIAGLCFLRPTPAYRNAIPTKIWEYWAVGIPVLGSNLPAQAKLIEQSGGGFVGEIEDLSMIVQSFIQNPDSAREVGQTGLEFYQTSDDGSEARLVDTISAAINP
tara:strand:- start:2039 stop:3064 length:1026 start_codon:yes stop_codon:yes gene_type:complete